MGGDETHTPLFQNMTDSGADILHFPRRARLHRSRIAIVGPFASTERDGHDISTEGALRAIIANIAAEYSIKGWKKLVDQTIVNLKLVIPPLDFHQMAYGDRASAALVAVMSRNILEAMPCSVYNNAPIAFMRTAIRHHLLDFDGVTTSPLALLSAIDRKSHIDIGPLTTHFLEGCTSASYHHGLILHRSEDAGPAVVTTDPSGVIIEQLYWLDGALHRNDGPAKIAFSPLDGSTTYEYWQHGCQHRADGPATIVFDADGAIQFEMWWRAGAGLHRDDGPAVTYGIPTDAWQQRHEFWVDGIFVRALENGVEVAT